MQIKTKHNKTNRRAEKYRNYEKYNAVIAILRSTEQSRL